MPTLKEYQKAFRSNPDAFIEGARRLCKEAASIPRITFQDVGAGDGEDEDSLWEKLRPWLIGIGGGYLALRAGEMWGRHAGKTGAPDGPIVGPVRELLLRGSHPGKELVWRDGPDGKSLATFRSKSNGQEQ